MLHIFESSKISELKMQGAWILKTLSHVLLTVACKAVVYESNVREFKCQGSKGFQFTLILVVHYMRQYHGSSASSISEYALLGRLLLFFVVSPPPLPHLCFHSLVC